MPRHLLAMCRQSVYTISNQDIEMASMEKKKRTTDDALKRLLKAGGRDNAKQDFDKILKLSSKPNLGAKK